MQNAKGIRSSSPQRDHALPLTFWDPQENSGASIETIFAPINGFYLRYANLPVGARYTFQADGLELSPRCGFTSEQLGGRQNLATLTSSYHRPRGPWAQQAIARENNGGKGRSRVGHFLSRKGRSGVIGVAVVQGAGGLGARERRQSTPADESSLAAIGEQACEVAVEKPLAPPIRISTWLLRYPATRSLDARSGVRTGASKNQVPPVAG